MGSNRTAQIGTKKNKKAQPIIYNMLNNIKILTKKNKSEHG